MNDDNEPGSKEDLKHTRREPQTEKLLRQFLKLESGMYGSKTWRKNYDLAVGKTEAEPFEIPVKCQACEYVANNAAEADWHASRNKGHGFGELEDIA